MAAKDANLDDDQAILALIDTDPERGMSRLIAKYQAKIHSVLRRRFGPDLAEDAFSVAAYLVWHHRSKYNPSKGSLAAWFTTIAINAAESLRRAHRKRQAAHVDLEWLPCPGRGPEESPLAQQRNAALYAAIEELSPREQEAVEDFMSSVPLTNPELAAKRQVSENAIAKFRSAAFSNLRKQLGENPLFSDCRRSD